MTNSSILKRCSCCKSLKSLDEFNKNRTCKDGLAAQCRSCQIISRQQHRASKKGKATEKRYRQSPECKAAQRQYRQTERGKASNLARQKRFCQSAEGKVKCKIVQHRYRQSPKGQRTQRLYNQLRRIKCPEKTAACSAVAYAILKGDLPKPTTVRCASCHKQAQEYHHPSYTVEHRLDVVALCKECHRQIHIDLSLWSKVA